MARISIIASEATLSSEGIRSVLQEHGHQVVFFGAEFDSSFSQLGGHPAEIVFMDVAADTAMLQAVTRWLYSTHSCPRLVGLVYSIQHCSLLSWPVLHIDGLLAVGKVGRLLACVSAVARGERWVDPDLVDAVMPGDAQFASLSPREQEVVNWIELGLRNKEIARKLNVSEGTVKMHLHHIFSKLRIQGRAQIALLAALSMRKGPRDLAVDVLSKTHPPASHAAP
jgi:two-component system, NarL family, nitrate/nitrite response regulator NarL